MPQPIASRVVTDACHVTYQTLLSWLNLPCGLLKFGKWLTTSIMLPVFTDLPSLRIGEDHTYFMALAYRTSSANPLHFMPHVSPVPSSEARTGESSSTEIGDQIGPKISTREVIKNASSLTIFEMCALW